MASGAHSGVNRESRIILRSSTAFHSINISLQLVSVISLLSSDTPNLDSPANVDAAKEVREDLAGACALSA